MKNESDGIKLRLIAPDEVEDAMSFVWTVFEEFECPDYSLEGMNSFRRDIIDNESYKALVRDGEIPMYVTTKDKEIVSLIAFRKSRDHLSLAFTKKEFQHRGIGSRLFKFAIKELTRQNPNLKTITVHSSPYGMGFYEKLGFVAISKRKETNGIIFVPMKYNLSK